LFKFCRSNGNSVSIGTQVTPKIEQSLQSYIFHRKTAIPFVTVKCAMSLDGKIAFDRNRGSSSGSSSESSSGSSSGGSKRDNIQWITSEQARKYVHQSRAQAQVFTSLSL
jgi:hypothetical protein